MKFKILKPITKVGILQVYFEYGHSATFEAEFRMLESQTRDYHMFQEWDKDVTHDIIVEYTFWNNWLKVKKFIEIECKSEDELRDAWQQDNSECPNCGSEIGQFEQDIDGRDFFMDEAEVRYGCNDCNMEWTDFFHYDDTNFDSM